jgi:CDGSH-type Zn-finger protein
MATRITVRPNGPYRIEGEIDLVDAQGKSFGLGGRNAISLCRCGHSQNKPFCDGSHKQVGFQDPGEARDLPAPQPK